MPDVRELPVPIVPDDWTQVDTSIDYEPPEIPQTLSKRQFQRHVDAITALLTTAGLTVTPSPTHRDDTAELCVTNPALDCDHTLSLTVRTDRSAEWVLDLGDEAPDAAPTTSVAAHVLALLQPARPRS